MMLKRINLKRVFVLIATHAAVFAVGVYYGLEVYEAYINDQFIVVPNDVNRQAPFKEFKGTKYTTV